MISPTLTGKFPTRAPNLPHSQERKKERKKVKINGKILHFLRFREELLLLDLCAATTPNEDKDPFLFFLSDTAFIETYFIQKMKINKIAVDGSGGGSNRTTTTTRDTVSEPRHLSLDAEEPDLDDDILRFLGKGIDTPSAGPNTVDGETAKAESTDTIRKSKEIQEITHDGNNGKKKKKKRSCKLATEGSKEHGDGTETARVKHNKMKDEDEDLSQLLTPLSSSIVDRSENREGEQKCAASVQQVVSDWPLSFHRHFVRSIFDAGLQNATPSKVMEQMICPGRRYSHQDKNPSHCQQDMNHQHLQRMIDNDSRSFREKLKSHLQKFKTHSDRERTKFLEEYTSALDTWTEMKTNVDDDERLQKAKGSGKSMQPSSPSPTVSTLQDVVGGRAIARTTFELLKNSSYFDGTRGTAAAERGQRHEARPTEQEDDQAARAEAAMALVQTKKGDAFSTKDNTRTVEHRHHCSDRDHYRGGMTILGFPTLTESERETALGQSILTTQVLITQLNKVLCVYREQQMTRQQTVDALHHDQRRTKKRHHHGQPSKVERLKQKRRRADKSRKDDIVYASPATMNAMIANVQLDDDDRLSIGECAFDAASNIDKTMTLEPPLQSHVDTMKSIEPSSSSREASKVTPMPMSESKALCYKTASVSDDLEPIQLFESREVSPVVNASGMLLQSRLRSWPTLQPQYGQNIMPFFSSPATVRDRSGSNASVETQDCSCSPYPCNVSHDRVLKPRNSQEAGTAISVDTRQNESNVDSSSFPFLRTSLNIPSSSVDVQNVRGTYQASLVNYDQNPCSRLLSREATATTVTSSAGSYQNESKSVCSKDTIDSLSPSTVRPLPAPPTFGNLNRSMTKPSSK